MYKSHEDNIQKKKQLAKNNCDYVTIGNSAFCLVLYLTGVHFRGELQHVGHVGE